MDELVEKLKNYFEEKSEILMAFLFGSAAAGRLIPESDVDVAVWFAGEHTLDDVNKMQGEIEDLLHRNVDLIVLNSARPTIAWAAMRGEALVIRNYRLFLNKLVEVSMEAEDIQDFAIDLFQRREAARKEAGK